jgi:hypothetical protein
MICFGPLRSWVHLDQQNNSELVKQLLARGAKGSTTTELFDAVAENPFVLDWPMEVVFSGQHCNQISVEMLYKDRRYIGFASFDAETLHFLLDYYKLDMSPKAILVIVMGNGSIKSLARLKNAGDQFVMDREVIEVAARLQLEPKSVWISIETRILEFAVIQNCRKIVSFLVYNGVPINEHVIVLAAKAARVYVTSLLLDYSSTHLVTSSVFNTLNVKMKMYLSFLEFFFNFEILFTYYLRYDCYSCNCTR